MSSTWAQSQGRIISYGSAVVYHGVVLSKENMTIPVWIQSKCTFSSEFLFVFCFRRKVFSVVFDSNYIETHYRKNHWYQIVNEIVRIFTASATSLFLNVFGVLIIRWENEPVNSSKQRRLSWFQLSSPVVIGVEGDEDWPMHLQYRPSHLIVQSFPLCSFTSWGALVLS